MLCRPYPWPAGYGGLTHIEKVSLEGEQPKKTPDFARTLAIASTLNDHHWVEPCVADEWREEAKRELDDMVEDEDGSSVYSGDEEDADGAEEAREGGQAVEREDGESSSPSTEASAAWPKGVVGLI
jgi:hypothetical protein